MQVMNHFIGAWAYQTYRTKAFLLSSDVFSCISKNPTNMPGPPAPRKTKPMYNNQLLIRKHAINAKPVVTNVHPVQNVS